MRVLPKAVSAALLLLLSLGACSEAGDPLSIDATGALAGLVALDRNGNNEINAGVDLPAVGVSVALLRGAGDTVATATSDAGGIVRFLQVPVGSYRLDVSPTSLGDSLRLVEIDSARVTVSASDTSVVLLTLGYPLVAAAQLGSTPADRMVTVEGVALHAANVFGDSLLHVRDSTGVVRATALSPQAVIATGDSVRVLGRVGSYLNSPALRRSTAFVLGTAQMPEWRLLTTAEAAGALGGKLDGALVRAADTEIISVTQLATGDYRVRVTDGSGVLEVLLDRDAQLSSEEPLLPGVKLDVTGILTPKEGTVEWVLKPRQSSDLKATIPEYTTAQIRSLPSGTLVSLRAIALNGIATFGDRSLHLADPTGAIRAVNVSSSFLFAGDSVRVVGTVGVQDGQPVITQASAQVLGKSAVPPPTLLSTQSAATANGGALDAGLVEVRGAVIEAIATLSSGDMALQVDDGSGDLVVLVDKDTGIGTGRLAVGDAVDVVGVLVPTGGGGWVLKPRSPNDLVGESSS